MLERLCMSIHPEQFYSDDADAVKGTVKTQRWVAVEAAGGNPMV